MPTKNRRLRELRSKVQTEKAKASEQVRMIQSHYLTYKKTSDHGPHAAFRIFSLDASDLQVLENIDKGVSGRTADVINRKEAIKNVMKNEKKAYKKAKKDLNDIMVKIEKAKKEMDLDLLDEAKKLVDKVSCTRAEIIQEKDELNKVLHDAINQLEI